MKPINRRTAIKLTAAGSHTIKIGRNKPDAQSLSGLESKPKDAAGLRTVKL